MGPLSYRSSAVPASYLMCKQNTVHLIRLKTTCNYLKQLMKWLSQTCCLFTNKTLQTTPIYKQREQERDRNKWQSTNIMVRNAIYWYKR